MPSRTISAGARPPMCRPAKATLSRGGEQPDDCLEERRLAGAVGADDGYRLALLEPQIDAIKGLEIAIEGAEASRFEHGHPQSLVECATSEAHCAVTAPMAAV